MQKRVLINLLLILPVYLFSQYSFDLNNGITLDIDIYGGTGNSYNASTSTITYSRKHRFTAVTVRASVNFGGFSSPCNTDEFASFELKRLTIGSSSIVSYTSTGGVDSSYSVGKFAVNGTKNDSYLEGYLSDLGAANVVFVVSVYAMGDCVSLADSTVRAQFGTTKNIVIAPQFDMGVIGANLSDKNGSDPIDLDHTALKPDIYKLSMKDLPPFPPDDNQFSQADDSPDNCSLYGRPMYSVNMNNLELMVTDREYYQPAPGPEIDIRRSFTGNAEKGMFGKYWYCSLEPEIYASCIHTGLASEAIIYRGNGRKYYFSYNPIDTSFISQNNEDSLSFTNGRLIWYQSNKHLKYVFDTLPGRDDPYLYNLVSIEDYHEQKDTIVYTDFNRIESITDAANRVITFSYNLDSTCSSFTLPDGRKTSYTYDAEGLLSNIEDLEGIKSKFTYDSLYNIATMDVNGQTTSFSYYIISGMPFLDTIITPDGKIYSYDLYVWTDYSKNKFIDPNGNATTYRSNRYGNTESVEDPMFNTGRNTYNDRQQLIKKELPNGEIAEFVYDNEGRIKFSKYYGTDSSWFEYDKFGNLTSYIDPMKHQHRYRHDSTGLLMYYINPAGDTTLYNYEKGRVKSVIRPEMGTTSYNYDSMGNITSVYDEIGLLFEIGYDSYGYFPVSLKNALGHEVKYEYDNNKRITKISKPNNQELNYTYDCCSQSSASDETGNILSVDRNAGNIITALHYPGNRDLYFSYNDNNNLTGITDPLGNTTNIEFDAANFPLSYTNPNGDRIELEYDGNHHITGVIDEKGNRTGYSYLKNRIVSSTDAMGNYAVFTYDKNGNMIRIRNSRTGSEVKMEYDFRGNITGKDVGTSKYSYLYDKIGRMKAFTKETGDSTILNWDKRNHLLQIKYGSKKEIYYTYDAAGRMVEMQYPDGTTINYGYNELNYVTSMIDGDDSITFEYDAAGNLISEKRSNHVTSQYEYNETGKMNKVVHYNNLEEFISLSYKHDLNGNITEMEVNMPVLLDFIEKKTNVDATYNVLNQLVSESGNNYSYDKDGNLVQISGNKNFFAKYTDENLIDSISTGGMNIKYSYNGLKQVVSKNINGVEHFYYYDLNNRLLFDANSSKEIVHTYLYAGNRLVAMKDPLGNIYFYHFDKMGNTLALTDRTGTLKATYWYTPFGEKIVSNSQVDNMFTFTGAYNVIDENNGFYVMGKRVYDPENGRFVQRDPKGMIDATNLYLYARNNPLIHIDPNGTDVANGTADLYNCSLPVYGDDFVSEETADAMLFTIDLGTDMIPVVGDVKTITKAGYYTYSGDYYKAGQEMLGFGVGKYLGGKYAPKIVEKVGGKSVEGLINGIIGKVSDVTIKSGSDAVSDMMNKKPVYNAASEQSVTYIPMGPPTGVHY